jgi:hypothetical protein
MSCLRRVIVINGNGNTSSLVFGQRSAAGDITLFDFSTATRFTLTFDVDGTETVIDTDDAATATAIRDGGDGEVIFDLGGASIPVGKYEASLVVYNPTYTSGFLLHEGEASTLELDVR